MHSVCRAGRLSSRTLRGGGVAIYGAFGFRGKGDATTGEAMWVWARRSSSGVCDEEEGKRGPAHAAPVDSGAPGRPEAPACGPWGWHGELTPFPSTRRTPAPPRCGSAYPVPEGILNPGLPAGPAQTPNVALSRTRVGFCLVASSGPEATE